MKVSVLIPAYNCAATVGATLDSVLGQTVPADEVLVMNDGSTDETVSVLNSFKPQVTVLHQTNRGVAASRNALIEQARGDLLAFVDTDDIWHPIYLEIQRRSFRDYPNAVAFITGHEDFHGYGAFEWKTTLAQIKPDIEVIAPLDFLNRYNECAGPFGSMSFCCIPKRVLIETGDEPFCVKASGADDFYLFNLLPRWGPVVYTPMPLVAYRITAEAQSEDQCKVVGLSVRALEILTERCRSYADPSFDRQLRVTSASRRRSYAKILMGTGEVCEARRQLRSSLRDSVGPTSKAKSAALLFLTHVPPWLQPTWPGRYRQPKACLQTVRQLNLPNEGPGM